MIWLVHGIAWNVFCVCGLLLIGLVVGRKLGIRQGIRRTETTLPLTLRKAAYQAGQCPICDTAFFGNDTIGQKGVVENERKSDLGRTTQKYGVG